ncbi:MAG: DNA-protecting protein DprA [Bacteroidales bacterium]|nr:DNA-protecting protein DprA [Bacteroidales bacterium]
MNHKIIEIDKASELFPQSLLAIGADCPEKLCLMGNVDLLKAEKAVAIIGARAADRNGCSKAYSLAVDFTKKGYVVVSGLALGCDSSAHRGCLAAHGKTIAIVGSGLDIVHPVENTDLQEQILKQQGLIISEQPLGVKASPKTLVRRNRLQAALSQMVVVAQCPVKSGTLYTVDFARKYGKEVFAAQFKYHNEFTGGNDKLLAEGIAKGI